jgi:hypothetical protein
MKNLKPVTFVNGPYSGGRARTTQNTTQQILLLKAMTVTQDPKKLRQMIGVRTVADVFRTLDKMAMRKEYHKALSKLGIDFEYIIKGIKDVCETAEKDDVRLKGYTTLLKSLGLDDYKEEGATDATGWEDILMKEMETRGTNKIIDSIPADYEVVTPKIPDSVKKQRALESAEGKSLYE